MAGTKQQKKEGVKGGGELVEVRQPTTRGLATVRGVTFVPAVVAERGAKAGERFVTFSTDNIRNPNTRRAYHRAVLDFFDWCEKRGLDFTASSALMRL